MIHNYTIIFNTKRCLSFPHAFSGNPLFIESNGCPIEAFGHDRFSLIIYHFDRFNDSEYHFIYEQPLKQIMRRCDLKNTSL